MESIYNNLRLNFLYVDQYTFSRNWIYPPNVVPYNMLRLIKSGSALFTIDGVETVVSKNQIVYVPQGSELRCQALEDNFTFISIRFTTSGSLTSNPILVDMLEIQRITRCEDEKVLNTFEETYQSRHSDSMGKMFRIRGNLELIMSYLVEQRELTKENSSFTVPESSHSIGRRALKNELKKDSRIEIIVEYLVNHPMDGLNTEKLCQMIDLSESSLRRLFKENTGKTLNEFIKELRMTTAAREIIKSDERISTIAYHMGFEDPNYFARNFKAIFGVSPSQYRRLSRE